METIFEAWGDGGGHDPVLVIKYRERGSEGGNGGGQARSAGQGSG